MPRGAAGGGQGGDPGQGMPGGKGGQGGFMEHVLKTRFLEADAFDGV
ncbi:hypothetical protein ACWCRF_34000 [Streptomyces sp. NPDC002405]